MKKFIAVFLCVLLICSLFVGCDKGKDESRTGTEIAKLMLANSRLNEELLKGGSDISGFSKVETNPLSAFLDDNAEVTTLAAKSSGDTVTWSDFDSEANTYKFFESYIVNIEHMAERAAQLIEKFKTDYNITDYWVNDSGESYLFQVNAGEEILYTKSDTGYFICKRYTNENAQDVYEMFTREKASDISVDHYTRMLYIPGVRYEFSYEQPAVNDNVYIVAENQRGFWNMFYVCDTGEMANFSNLVTTNSIAFDYFDSIFAQNEHESLPNIRFSTPDLKSDIITFSNHGITLHFGAFNGIAAVTIPKEKSQLIEGSGGGYVTTVAEGSVVTTAGKTINPGDTFAGGKVMFSGALADEKNIEDEGSYTFGYADLTVEGSSVTERFANLKTALSEMGITCKYSIDNVAANVPVAETIGNQFVNYYNWNGYNLSAYSNVKSSIAVESGKASAFDEMFEKVKDNKSVAFTPKGLAFENYSFAELNSFASGNVTFDGSTVTVTDMSAVLNDLTLVDAGKEYTINLALARLTGTGNEALAGIYKNGNITLADVTLLPDTEADYDRAVILEKAGGSSTKFVAQNTSLELKQSASFKLPGFDAEGTYTIVAYVATNDGGIRISQMLPVAFTTAQKTDISYPGIDGLLSLNEKNEFVASYVRNMDIFVTSDEGKTTYTYSEAYDKLLNTALNFGLPLNGAAMELYNTATNMSSTASSSQNFSNCVLRLKYIATDNSGAQKQSYVYLTIK